MNTIKIYLKTSGSVAELYKDFALFVNAYQNKLVDVYGSKYQFENGRRAPAFEPFAKNKAFNPEKGEIGTEINETETANDRVETKNKKRGRLKTKNKVTPQTTQKFSNHIKFIDYIPIHELITYRHLFAYGFYVE